LKARESDVSRLPLRGAAGTRVLLVVSATDFQWSDIAPLRAAWQPAPGVLHLASWANPITNAQRAGQSASVDRLLSDARAEDYDVLIVAGGAGLMYLTERNGDHESIRSLISEMLTSSKPVGAIGAGPGVLASCGVLNGLSAAGHPLTHADVLERFHVQLLDQPVVRSDYIVTARDVNASAALVREIRTVLGAR
jgi:putative intracellular protease/amidase